VAKANTATNTVDHIGAVKDAFENLQAQRSKAFADYKAAEHAPDGRVARNAKIDRGAERNRQKVEQRLDRIDGQGDPIEYIERLPPVLWEDLSKSLVLSNPAFIEYLKKFLDDKFGDGVSDRSQHVADAKAKLRAVDEQIVKLCSSAGFELPTYLLPEAVINFDEKTKSFDETKVGELQTDLDSVVDRCSRVTAQIRDRHIDLAKLRNTESELNTQLSRVDPRKRDDSPASKSLKSVRDQITSTSARLAELQTEEKDLAARRSSRSKSLNNVRNFLRENHLAVK
jgi:hypothetical protein